MTQRKTIDRLLHRRHSRRSFLKGSLEAGALSALAPLLGCGARDRSESELPDGKVFDTSWDDSGRSTRVEVAGGSAGRLLLENGLIVDGTGSPAYYGDLLINGGEIEFVTAHDLDFRGRAIDCTGKVVAPGFIDMHSHMDWVLPIEGRPELETPFTAQGVTTFVGGNCGFGMAGYRKDSRHKDILRARTAGLFEIDWDSMDGYFAHLAANGISHNLLNLSGYGTTRASIKGFDPAPLTPDELKELLYLLEETLEQGAGGVSLGLQYEPGIFARMNELEEVARLVKRRDKILTVHMKAYSSLSPSYALNPFGRAHNLLAIEDMLKLARETGVRLELSHLIFVGEASWDTCHEALALIDAAIEDGVDVKFDTYAYHCGTSIINVVMPEWFLARAPEVYEDRVAVLRLHAELQLITRLLGFGYDDIQITKANHPDLEQFNGLFLGEIAQERKMSPFENFVDVARKSRGRARVLNHRYSILEHVLEMMRHPASLFMTDAMVAPEGVQNPAAFGNFPLFLQYARDYSLISLEEAVHKMTGASAERFKIKGRGILKNGYAADITVFDWKNVRDNNTEKKTNARPDGIEMVFINGQQVVDGEKIDSSVNAGVVV
ncbi:MAG: amidohydrolase family protein [Deltaproteobacteria bacterium]|nr:amidohydrolase family protein [Deltaproteobacteria bacterium]